MFLSGGGAKLHGLKVYLAKNLSVQVEILNAFKNIDTSQFDAEKLAQNSFSYGVAIGLAL